MEGFKIMIKSPDPPQQTSRLEVLSDNLPTVQSGGARSDTLITLFIRK